MAKTGIRFDENSLDELGLSIQELESNPQGVMISEIPGTDPTSPSNASSAVPTMTAFALIWHLSYQLVWWILRFIPVIWNYLNSQATAQADPTTSFAMDVFAEMYNQLFEHWVWWVLEFIPMLSTYQNEDGSWRRRRWSVHSQMLWYLLNSYLRRNYGRGRYLPYTGNEVKVHRSVKSRMGQLKYRPAAYNWGKVCDELKMVKWED